MLEEIYDDYDSETAIGLTFILGIPIGLLALYIGDILGIPIQITFYLGMPIGLISIRLLVGLLF